MIAKFRVFIKSGKRIPLTIDCQPLKDNREEFIVTDNPDIKITKKELANRIEKFIESELQSKPEFQLRQNSEALSIIAKHCETLIDSSTDKGDWSKDFCSGVYAVLGRINSLKQDYSSKNAIRPTQNSDSFAVGFTEDDMRKLLDKWNERPSNDMNYEDDINSFLKEYIQFTK